MVTAKLHILSIVNVPVADEICCGIHMSVLYCTHILSIHFP